VLVLLVGAYFGGAKFSSKIEYRINEVEKVIEVPRNAPVLERIATCESGGKHLDKTGQVVFKANTNGSVDIGLYQINNRLWGRKATEMGLNLTVEKDNKIFAEYLYATRGTADWYLSAKCWNR